MKSIHLHVDGKRRRICDIVASSPWAVNCGLVTTRSVHGMSVAIAEGILRDRTNVVFSDEAASEINGLKTWDVEPCTSAATDASAWASL